jgi:hypothetical protein
MISLCAKSWRLIILTSKSMSLYFSISLRALFLIKESISFCNFFYLFLSLYQSVNIIKGHTIIISSSKIGMRKNSFLSLTYTYSSKFIGPTINFFYSIILIYLVLYVVNILMTYLASIFLIIHR